MPLENITTSESDIQENKHINDSTNNILSKVDDDDDAKIDKVIQEPVQQEPSNNSSSLPLTAENSNMPVSEDEPCENHTESDATESNCIDSSTNNNLYEVDNKADGKTGKGWGKMLNTLRSIKSGTMKFINAVKILVYDDVSLENITTSESDIQENKHINDSTNNILSKVDGDDANIDKIIQEPVQREPSNNSSSLPPKAENSEENGKSKSWNKEMELINKEQTNQNAKQLFNSQLFKVPVCDHNMISIRFYFVALNFDYDLYVMFGHKDLGNWKQPAVHMHKYRYYSEQMANIYVGDLHCSKEIFGKKSIEYKYVLINGENYIWEHLKFESQSTSVTNRVLHISKEFLKVLDKDIIFFQVDDLYLPPKSSVISKVYANHHYNKYISVENQPKSEIYVSVFNMYVDMLEDETHNTIESSMFIKSLLSGFYHAHFMTANIQAPWIKIKDNQLITKLFKAIKKRFDHKEHELFFPSLSLLLIFYDDQNLVDLMPTNFISLVFENLSVESYNWCYSEIFDKIVQCFPEKYLRFIESALSSLLQSWFEKYNNSEAKPHVWCYALLIKHVISHESINNQEKINDSNCGLPTFINKNLLKHLGVYELIFDDLQKIKGSLLKDILLQRAIAYLMEFKYFVGALKTEAFNKHLLINMMTYHIKSSTCSDDMINGCYNFLDELQKWNFFEMDCNRGDLVKPLINMLDVSLIMLEINDNSCSLLSKMLNCIYEFYKTINPLDNCLTMLNKTIQNRIPKVKNNFQKKFNEAQSSWNTLSNIESQLKVMEMLVDFEITKGNEFKELASDILNNKIKNAEDSLLLEAYCQLEILSYKELIQQPLTESFWSVIEKMSQNKPDCLYRLSEICSPIFINYIIKKWKCLNSAYKKVEFCLTWPHFKVFLEHLGEKSTEEIKSFIQDVISEFCYIFTLIDNGEITIKFLIFLKEKEEILFGLMRVMKLNFFEDFKASYDMQFKQLSYFNKGKEVMKYIYQLIKVLLPDIVKTEVLIDRVNSSYLVQTLKKGFADSTPDEFSETSDFTDNNEYACRTLPNDDLVFVKKVCMYFKISLRWFEFAFHVTNCNVMSSFLFQKEVHSTAKSLKENIDYTQLFDRVIIPASQNLENLFGSIVSCKISPSDVVFIFSENQNAYKTELFLLKKYFMLNDDEVDIETCVEKINFVFLIVKYSNIAEAIQKVRKSLSLNGDFTIVENMMIPIDKVESLQSIENNSNILASFFEMFSSNILEIFTAISSCQQLIFWLRENLKNPKEVGFLVEIMSLAAGETDYDIGKISCFEACCLAFNHIIFDLTKKSGFNDLFKACKEIEGIMSSDPNILKNLTDTNSNLEWFKNAKKSQGSVTMKSIMETQFVNRKGYFIIGNKKSRNVDFSEFNLADIIKFKIRKKKN